MIRDDKAMCETWSAGGSAQLQADPRSRREQRAPKCRAASGFEAVVAATQANLENAQRALLSSGRAAALQYQRRQNAVVHEV
eukprot:152239-Prymnesium_polylepis.1